MSADRRLAAAGSTGSVGRLRERLSAGRLIVPSCYDALGLRMIARAGFPAGFLSGFSVSAARLGAPDAGLLSYGEMAAQVRDVALAALVTLTKQDAKEYFGAEIPPRTRSAYSVFPAMTIGFEVGEEGEKRRAAAQQKWAEYKQRQAKPAERAAGEGSP